MANSQYSEAYLIFLRLLRTAREEAGLTQVQLAERLRATQSLVSKCERGERRLDVIELRGWLLALGLSLSDFTKRLEDEL